MWEEKIYFLEEVGLGLILTLAWSAEDEIKELEKSLLQTNFIKQFYLLSKKSFSP